MFCEPRARDWIGVMASYRLAVRAMLRVTGRVPIRVRGTGRGADRITIGVTSRVWVVHWSSLTRTLTQP